MSEADNRMEELAARVERASGADRELDAKIARAVGKIPVSAAYEGTAKMGDLAWQGGFGYKVLAYTASIDAAMTLVPEGWNWMAGNRNQPTARAYVENGEPAFDGAGSRANPRRQWFEVVAATPALALTSACLRARALPDARP